MASTGKNIVKRRKAPIVTPPRLIIMSFTVLIVAGAMLLKIPGMHRLQHLDWADAFFTSTSAVCVTGLATLDTGSAWTFAGQFVIIMLIQLGGLGIMGFSVLLFELAGRNLSISQAFMVRESYSHKASADPVRLIRSVLMYTFGIEFIGAVLFFPAFAQNASAPEALFQSVFHSVSAFCNAGFSLWPDSLSRYGDSIAVNLVALSLIISGGLGFLVLQDLAGFIGNRFRNKKYNLSLHSRIVCWTTFWLILIGAMLFLLFEWGNVLNPMDTRGKILTSFFQSITPRTAGFNTIDYEHLTNASLLMTIFLMFIGGSPGSMAGGIKTVTITMLFAMALSRYRGFTKVNVFKRSIHQEIVTRSLTITLLSIGVVFLMLALLMTTETWGLDHTRTRDVFMELMFETVSAFGTVGLSMGVTSKMTVAGKAILIATMFLGRIGPITVALALMRKAKHVRPYNFGHEDVMIG